VPPRDLGGFRVGQAPGRRLRGFAVDQRLIDIGLIDLEGNSEGPEDLRPAGGGGGEDEVTDICHAVENTGQAAD
jgi:hypothetical protein